MTSIILIEMKIAQSTTTHYRASSKSFILFKLAWYLCNLQIFVWTMQLEATLSMHGHSEIYLALKSSAQRTATVH